LGRESRKMVLLFNTGEEKLSSPIRGGAESTVELSGQTNNRMGGIFSS